MKRVSKYWQMASSLNLFDDYTHTLRDMIIDNVVASENTDYVIPVTGSKDNLKSPAIMLEIRNNIQRCHFSKQKGLPGS